MKFPGNKRYNSLTAYLKSKFGGRFQKVTVDAGFTCPNRDGKLAMGGCTYCDNNAFNPSYNNPKKSIAKQVQEGIEFHKNRYKRANHFLVYFQPYSNTYDRVDKLQKMYKEALEIPGVEGIVIGTRPDCLDEGVLDLLVDLNRNKFVLLELGVESTFDITLDKINRKHHYRQAEEAILNAASAGLHTGVHMIFGLPGENMDMMMESVSRISELPVNSVKFHQLQIIKGTAMAKDYRQNPGNFNLFSYEQYLGFICDVVEILNPRIMIDRLAGEVPPRFLEVQSWTGLRYDQVLNRIEKELDIRNTYQGKKYNKRES